MARKNIERKQTIENKDFKLTNKEGAMRELIATKLLMELGYVVCKPNLDVRYDLIAEKYPMFLRIQVKNLKLAYIKDDNSPFSLDQWEINAFSMPKGNKRTYSIEDCDLIMGIDLETEKYAIIPIEKVPQSGKCRLSVHPTCKCRDYFNSIKALKDIEELCG